MHFVIITAGGTGQRMGSASPKQFIQIGNKPVIIHTIEKFLEFESDIEIVLTLLEDYFDDWKNIKEAYLPNTEIKLVKGGETRFDSINNALNAISNDQGLVAIHDAVRPFVSVKVIKDCFENASKYGSGVASIGLKDSIRELDQNKSFARDRAHYRLMQTPQTFDLKKIKAAFAKASDKKFTDDAGVWENAGNEVFLVEGNRFNIKITYPEDITLAEAILNS